MAVDPLYQKLQAKPLPVPPADQCPAPTHFIVSALQALERGDATAAQQKAAINFIISDVAGAYTPQFRKDARETDFGLGRAFVGQQIVGFLKINLAYFTEKETRNGR